MINSALLEEIGLDEKESIIYLANLELGKSPSSIIGNKVKIPKSTTKYILDNLVKKGLIIGLKEGNTDYYYPEHPQKLQNILTLEKNKLESKENKLNHIMSDLIKMYNPKTKIPKIKFYEGLEGLISVLNDSLNSKEIIYTYSDIENISKSFDKINKEYLQERIKQNIRRKSIYQYSPTREKYLNEIYNNNSDLSLNDVKMIKDDRFKMYISMSIYDGKISYITLRDKNYIGVIIEDEDIYKFHKNMFEYTWNTIE